MVDILAAVALKCRWTDCNRELERRKDDSINVQQKDEAVQVVTCNASKTLREVFAKFNRLQFLPCGLSITSAGSRRAYAEIYGPWRMQERDCQRLSIEKALVRLRCDVFSWSSIQMQVRKAKVTVSHGAIA